MNTGTIVLIVIFITICFIAAVSAIGAKMEKKKDNIFKNAFKRKTKRNKV